MGKRVKFFIQVKILQPILLLNTASPFLNAELPHFIFFDVPMILLALTNLGI